LTKLKKILIITTGGTIAHNIAFENRYHTLIDKAQFHNKIGSSLEKLNIESGYQIKIETYELCSVDSSDILPNHWQDIAKYIKSNYDIFDAFLITHGTNTISYTAAALSFIFENLMKPVILTGSQIPYGYPGSDAIINMENALRIAIGVNKNPLDGVTLVFGSHIISGVKVKKSTEFDYDAFHSYNSNSIGRIGRTIVFNENKHKKHLSYIHKSESTYKVDHDPLILNNHFEKRVLSLTEFPGMGIDIFKSLVTQLGIKGFILRAFGAGDASTNLKGVFEYLKSKKIPIVVTSQAPNGISNFKVNEPGQILSRDELAIPAWDMSIEAQTVKLMWLLGQRLSYEEIKKLMIHDFRGEIQIKHNS